MVRARIDIAKHFDMLTVAKFVETRAEAETLIALGADCLQGFYFSAPPVRPKWSENKPEHAAS